MKSGGKARIGGVRVGSVFLDLRIHSCASLSGPSTRTILGRPWRSDRAAPGRSADALLSCGFASPSESSSADATRRSPQIQRRQDLVSPSKPSIRGRCSQADRLDNNISCSLRCWMNPWRWDSSGRWWWIASVSNAGSSTGAAIGVGGGRRSHLPSRVPSSLPQLVL